MENLSVTQACCEPKNSFKNKVFFKKVNLSSKINDQLEPPWGSRDLWPRPKHQFLKPKALDLQRSPLTQLRKLTLMVSSPGPTTNLTYNLELATYQSGPFPQAAKSPFQI